MFAGFKQIYLALVEYPWAATAAIFAVAWAYERFRNARLSQALLELSTGQIKAVANVEITLASFKDTVLKALLHK